MPFTFQKTAIPDVILITPKIFGDDRGFFLESYKASEFRENGIPDGFVQDNHSRSARGVLRGLHYQLPPHAQGKLVRCIAGSIFDVAVDIRKNSSDFGKWTGHTLDAEKHEMLYIPPGFAHGFLTLSETAEVHYKVTAEYAPESDRGIIWNDSQIHIKWPHIDVILSDKDKQHPGLGEAEVFNKKYKVQSTK